MSETKFLLINKVRVGSQPRDFFTPKNFIKHGIGVIVDPTFDYFYVISLKDIDLLAKKWNKVEKALEASKDLCCYEEAIGPFKITLDFEDFIKTGELFLPNVSQSAHDYKKLLIKAMWDNKELQIPPNLTDIIYSDKRCKFFSRNYALLLSTDNKPVMTQSPGKSKHFDFDECPWQFTDREHFMVRSPFIPSWGLKKGVKETIVEVPKVGKIRFVENERLMRFADEVFFLLNPKWIIKK